MLAKVMSQMSSQSLDVQNRLYGLVAALETQQGEQHQQENRAAQDDCQVAAKYEDGFSAFQDSCQAAMKVGCYMAKACSHILEELSAMCVHGSCMHTGQSC